MTGYGRGEATEDGLRCTVEVSSVNRRQSDVDVRMPREFSVLEGPVRRMVAAVSSRGKVQVGITLEDTAVSEVTLKVDHVLARQYAEALRGLAVELQTDIHFGADTLLRAPGVFTVADSRGRTAEEVQPLMETALKRALAVWDEARLREGAHLQADLAARLAAVAEVLAQVKSSAPAVAAAYRDGLRRRLEDAGLPLPLEDERLIKEIALFADRSDISEEISRLGAHLEEFGRLLASDEPSGRAMDFLAQEMNRELNTMGAKANQAGIAHQVVVGKTEVERIREQVQNAE